MGCLSWAWANKQLSGLEGKVQPEPWRGHRAVHRGARPVGPTLLPIRCAAQPPSADLQLCGGEPASPRPGFLSLELSAL